MTEFVYTLPADELQVMAEGLTYGHYDAMRDFPKKTLRTPKPLIAQAHRRCAQISARVQRQGKTLCNDLKAFKQIFTGHYVGIYPLRTAVYDKDPGEHKKDIKMERELGPEKSYLARKALMLEIVNKNKVQEDKTYKQALAELETRVAKDIYNTIQAKIKLLAEGTTVAEVTSDIADERIRKTVSDIMLNLHVNALIASLKSLGVLNHKQVEELHAYLKDHLVL